MDETTQFMGHMASDEHAPMPSVIELFGDLTRTEIIQMQANSIDSLLTSTTKIEQRIEAIGAKIKALESGEETTTIQSIEENNTDVLKGMYHSLASYLQNKGPLWHDLAIKTVLPHRVAFDVDGPKAFGLVHTLLTGSRLPERHFITRSELPIIGPDQPILTLQADRATSIALPAANFISAEGFIDWQTGRGADHLKTDEKSGISASSAATIRDYATRQTDIPPADMVEGYVQPNGYVVYRTVQGSHRTAAMLQGGSDTIATRSVMLYKIDHDIIPV